MVCVPVDSLDELLLLLVTRVSSFHGLDLLLGEQQLLGLICLLQVLDLELVEVLLALDRLEDGGDGLHQRAAGYEDGVEEPVPYQLEAAGQHDESAGVDEDLNPDVPHFSPEYHHLPQVDERGVAVGDDLGLLLTLQQLLHEIVVLPLLQDVGVNKDDQLQDGLGQTELILDLAPLDLVAEQVLREGHVLAPEADLGEPDDVVREVVDETADGRDHLHDLDVDVQLGVVDVLVNLVYLVQPQQEPEDLPTV